ncbi:MAG: dephospho-CoA kinase [Oscillospiraceae bacterium]|nr:dephospho-CoA kinase [Oscillospiraceae bacterium]
MGKLLVGLTGQTGAGKSTVSELLQKEGFGRIDADAVSRTVCGPGMPCVLALAEAFGEEILLPGQVLDRRGLAKKAFSSPENTALLNRITHPFIKEEIRRQTVEAFREADILLLDAPTLYESGCDSLCGYVIAVIADPQIRRERILSRDGITPQEAERRMSAQGGDEFYTARADLVIRNDGSLEELIPLCKNAADLLRKIAAPNSTPCI